MNKAAHVAVIHHSGHTLSVVLYAVGFALQLAGGALIAKDIIDDSREARRLRSESLPVRWNSIDETVEATIRYLAGREGRRWLGVVLFVVGAAVAFAGNLTALR